MNNKASSVIKISALALVLSFGLSYALAWTAPTATPPGANVAAPINESNFAQTKSGDLTLGRLFTTASSSIGTTAQTQTLTVAGTIGATEDICTAAGGGVCLSTATGGGIDPAPIGSIVSYAGAAAPSGYLICNGASLLRSAYPALFTAIGTTYGFADATHFNIPDLRGEFIRGFSNGRAGVDVGRVFGSWQDDLFQSHSHSFVAQISGIYTYANVGGTQGVPSAGNTASTGGSETRPRNVAMNYIIKAEQASVVATSTLNVVSTITAGAGITLDKVSPATGDVTVTAAALGVGQTWQNVTASRALNTSYTNSTGKPIMVQTLGYSGSAGGGYVYATLNGVNVPIGNWYSAGGSYPFNGTVVVPSGATYSVSYAVTAGAPTYAAWFELR